MGLKTITLLLLLFPFYLSAQNVRPVEKREINTEAFDQIKFDVGGEMYVTIGETRKVEIETHPHIFERVQAEAQAGKLTVKPQRAVTSDNIFKVYIVLPALSYLELTGSGEIHMENYAEGYDFTVLCQGSGEIRVKANVKHLMAGNTGSGDIFIEGSGNTAEYHLTGSGDILASEWKGQSVDARLKGSGDLEVSAEKELSARISGSGDVICDGNPEIDEQISGSGEIIRR